MKVPLSERFRYSFDNFISRGTIAMINGLGIFTVLVVAFISGILLLILSISRDSMEDMNFFHALWLNLTHMLDPGTVSGTLGSKTFMIFMMAVTLIGLVIISTLIGLVSNGILAKIETLRKGRSFVIEQNHVLILGYSSKIFTIISELVLANENQKKGVVVILADKDKVQMEDEIRDMVGNTKNTRVICRKGNPIDVHDLYIANPFDTKSIIILGKDNENSDSQIIKTVVAIVTNPNRRPEPYHITAEIENKKNFDVAKMVGANEVELILSDEIISRIMVQTSRQSGLSVVYIELMDFGGDEIYFMEEPEMVGKTFREALFSYNDSAIIGIQFANEEVIINPNMDTVMREGDKVIGITEDDDTLVPNIHEQMPVDDANISNFKPEPPEPESILLVGWNARARHIVVELDNYVPKDSKVRIVTKFSDSREVAQGFMETLKNISVEYSIMDTTDWPSLESIGLDNYGYIILLCYQQHFSLQEADAQTLITLLHLRNFTQTTGSQFKIVSEMLDIRNRELADITSADDFIVSDKILSLMMTQVSENKFLMRVFEDLFDADGSEIYIKPAHEYVRLGAPINFFTVLESAVRKNEVAIGYRLMKYARNARKGYGVYVNPKKTDMFILSRLDKVIVLSED